MTAATAAPSSSTVGHHQFIPLAKLTASPLNHRKNFPKASMEDLANSIRAQGVIQPILARPLTGDKFEVVAGERRFRAAKAAGLVDIPAIVRELDDAKVLELQVIENNQRENVHPLEEAEGYEALMKVETRDGTKYNADEIASKIGKSRSYVFGRLKLCALCPEARQAFYDDKIDASKALLVARIAHHDTQRQALKDLVATDYRGGTISYREAHKLVLDRYMLALKAAPFDTKDAALVEKAGACGPCPKRTGNQAELFGDVKSADVCTDPKCFSDKRIAHYATAAKDLEAKGKKVAYGEAAKKYFPSWESDREYMRDGLAPAYVGYDETTYATGRTKKVSELLGEDYEPIHVQHPVTGKILKVATQQAVTAAAQKAQRASASTKSKSSKASSKNRAPAQPAAPDPEEVLRKRLHMHVFAALPKKLGEDELRWIAEELMFGDVDFELIESAFFPSTNGNKPSPGLAQTRIEQALPKLDLEGLTRLVVAIAVCGDQYGGNDTKRLERAAKLYKVDLARVRADHKAELKAAEKTKDAKPAAAGKAKAKS